MRWLRGWLWIVGIAAAGIAAPAAAQSSGGKPPWALALHGGAGTIAKDMDPALAAAYRAALRHGLELGKSILEKGGTSLEAVEAVVRSFEEDSLFNAGKGAVYTHEGTHELDAAIMDGATLRCGAVAAVRTVRNPIVLARLVMEKSRHILLAGDGAEAFGRSVGVEFVEPHYFDTHRRREQLQKALADDKYGTVGCVALDRHGNLAAATSTGGLTNKRFGRIGDTPILGAGTYASNRTCAVSCTGRGEQFMRHTVARDVAALVEYKGLGVREAAAVVVHGKLEPGDGGLIAVGRDGEIAFVFNTSGMYRGAADARGRFEVAIWED
jgi:beta-aspartyl-peptidase (threonine type)